MENYFVYIAEHKSGREWESLELLESFDSWGL